jgi:hypothetical protein
VRAIAAILLTAAVWAAGCGEQREQVAVTRYDTTFAGGLPAR